MRNFSGKVGVIEEVDRRFPEILSLNPDVLVVTSDHSTPARFKAHSWHPVPVLIHSKLCRPDSVVSFDEIACIGGGLGRQAAVGLMGVVLANAGRLTKFGA